MYINAKLGDCGVSVSELHNGLEKLLSLSKMVKIDFANIIIMTGKQRVAIAVFS